MKITQPLLASIVTFEVKSNFSMRFTFNPLQRQ